MAGEKGDGAEPLEQDFRLLTELAQGFMVSQVGAGPRGTGAGTLGEGRGLGGEGRGRDTL